MHGHIQHTVPFDPVERFSDCRRQHRMFYEEMLNERFFEFTDILYMGRRRGFHWRQPYCRRLISRYRMANLRRRRRLTSRCRRVNLLHRRRLNLRGAGYSNRSIDRFDRYPGRCGVSVSTGSFQRREAAGLKKGEAAPPFCGAPLPGSTLVAD